MDQLTAHLDRGWDLAQHGDVRGAEESARQALAIDGSSPEVHNLLGFVSAMNGEGEEALEHYKSAIALDEGYFDAMLNAAEVLVHPLAQYDEAVEMCDEALSWAENEEEAADALLIKIDALLAKHDEEGVRRTLASMPEGPFQSERYDFLIGRAFFEAGLVEQATLHIDRVLKKEEKHSDAWYYRGLILDGAGSHEEATAAFLEVRRLDEDAPRAPWALESAEFESVARKAIGTLDPALRRFVSDARLFIVSLPGFEVVAEGVDPHALLLLDAIASPERPGPPCGRIFFYQRNFERILAAPIELADELVFALETEITAMFLEDRRERPRDKSDMN